VDAATLDTARGTVALERLAEDAHGDLVYTFTKPWSGGTTGMTLSPARCGWGGGADWHTFLELGADKNFTKSCVMPLALAMGR
jgi:hypothetical protein